MATKSQYSVLRNRKVSFFISVTRHPSQTTELFGTLMKKTSLDSQLIQNPVLLYSNTIEMRLGIKLSWKSRVVAVMVVQISLFSASCMLEKQ
jgi:hypothetical protein